MRNHRVISKCEISRTLRRAHAQAPCRAVLWAALVLAASSNSAAGKDWVGQNSGSSWLIAQDGGFALDGGGKGVLPRSVQIEGDFDFDGDVDAADFLVWQRGGSPTPLGPADLAIWKSQFIATNGNAHAAGGVVPEPAGWLMAACALVLLRRRRTQRQSSTR